MTEQLLVSAIGHSGDGIVEHAERRLYVPLALPGETVEVAPVPDQPDRLKLRALKIASPDRVSPICRHFGSCGGCRLQHLQLARYHAFKRDLLREALSRVGLASPIDELVDAHGAGRRRVVLHARFGGAGQAVVGFAAWRSHRLVAIEDCPVLAPELAGALALARELAAILSPHPRPLDVALTATLTGLDVDIRGSGPLSPVLRAALARCAQQHALARLTRHAELVAQHAAPVVAIGRARLVLPPGAFLQATAAGELELARRVTELTAESRAVADLFAGVGCFALRMADYARVRAFDCAPAALAALRTAAAATRGLKPITAEARDLFRHPLSATELARCDAVVFNPPRQGARAQAIELARSAVPAVIAVSCNPLTFARDARILVDGGYRLTRVTPIDQFRYTPHLEVVGCFVR